VGVEFSTVARQRNDSEPTARDPIDEPTLLTAGGVTESHQWALRVCEVQLMHCSWRFVLFNALMFAAAPVVSAQTGPGAGLVEISWDRCAPIVPTRFPTAGPIVFFASVIGHSSPHQRYEIRFLLRNDDYPHVLPDAWRFDPDGCNAGSFQFTGSPAFAEIPENCPVFVPITVQRVSVARFDLVDPSWGFSPGIGTGYLGLSYANGGAGSPNHDANQRYLLGRFTFDHTWSVSGPTPDDGSACGGLEKGMCVHLFGSHCQWTDLTGTTWGFATSPQWLVVKGTGSGFGCFVPDFDPTPAPASTWGSIKAQYR
jgi:hypothetical protein